MKTFAFALQKGGVGKTSAAVSIAVELAKHGNTLLIDADPQGNASSWLNIQNLNLEFADYLNKRCSLDQVSQATQIENLFIIPTASIGGTLKDFAETTAVKQPFFFDDFKSEIASHFDYCVFDLPPNFGAFETGLLIHCDKIITVLQCTEFARDGLTIFNERLNDAKHGLRIKDTDAPFVTDIILNAKDDRKLVHKHVYENLMQLSNIYKMHTIPLEPSFEKAQSMHVVLQNYADTKKETLQSLQDITNSLIG